MRVDIQYNDGTREVVDHTQFYKSIRNKNVYRFSIGSADFYNHDFYALEELPNGSIRVSEWDLASNYPGQNWGAGGHACVYEIKSPTQWRRVQYGQGSLLGWNLFAIPANNIKISGLLIPDTESDSRRNEWPISMLPDWGKEGVDF